MNRRIVVIGMLVLVIGLVLISSRNIDREVINEEFEKVEDEWNIAGNFDQGENLSFYFIPHADWSLKEYFPGPGLLPMKIFWVNITNVAIGNYTLFNVTMVPPLDKIPVSPPYDFLLYIYEIEVMHHGALLVKDETEDVGGIAKNNGLYIVNCSLFPPTVMDRHITNGTVWPHEASPPPELRLYKIKEGTEQPYTFLLPVGIITSAAGVAVSIWGVRRKKGKVFQVGRSQEHK